MDTFLYGKWRKYLAGMAQYVATGSNDPDTKVGALLVTPDHNVILTGYNGFPKNVEDKKERWAKPIKYDYVVHAEQNLLNVAAKLGISVKGNYIIVTHKPCLPCTKNIITSQVKSVYYINDYIGELMTKEKDDVIQDIIKEYAGGNSGFFMSRLFQS